MPSTKSIKTPKRSIFLFFFCVVCLVASCFFFYLDYNQPKNVRKVSKVEKSIRKRKVLCIYFYSVLTIAAKVPFAPVSN